MELFVDFHPVAKVTGALSSSALWSLTRGLLPPSEFLKYILEREEQLDVHTLIS
jgi:hypothetical protein